MATFTKCLMGIFGTYPGSDGEASHKRRSEVWLTNGNLFLWFDWINVISTDQLFSRIQVEGRSILNFNEKLGKLLPKLVILAPN